MGLISRAIAMGLVLQSALGAPGFAQEAAEVLRNGAPDNEHAREYLGPSDNNYMILQGRIIQLEDRMAAAEEAIQALIKKLDDNALRDTQLLEKLEAAGVIRQSRSGAKN